MKNTATRYLIWALVIVLAVLHQDFWQRDNATLVFGFLPHSLAYHCGISIAAALVWWVAVSFYWADAADALGGTASPADDGAE